MRRLRWIVLAALVLAIVVYGLGELHKRRDWRDQFRDGKGQLVSVTETFIEKEGRNSLLELRLENESGLRVRGNIRVPDSGDRHSVLVLLGGLRTGKETLAYIGPTEGVILVALDYPYEGKRRDLTALEGLMSLPAMRHAIVSTPAAAALTLDYLVDRHDVDPDRIVLVGGSIGALFGPAVATDERFAAVALLLGGADLDGLLEWNLDDVPFIVRKPLAWPLSVIVSPVEPAKYVAGISPRPLLMINATEDPAIPAQNARLMHEIAAEPKTVKWIEAGHVTIRDKKFGRLVIRELVTWLTEHDLTPPGAFDFALDGNH